MDTIKFKTHQWTHDEVKIYKNIKKKIQTSISIPPDDNKTGTFGYFNQ